MCRAQILQSEFYSQLLCQSTAATGTIEYVELFGRTRRTATSIAAARKRVRLRRNAASTIVMKLIVNASFLAALKNANGK